ncbi:hypothetical protein [Actinocrispum sp. NPDC049592]|uniref:hypothetical protein n=1 Tax=Actinocrispum sp. NPDC049592 TaxID=3154835 RepID=UPI00343C75C5
MSEKAPTPVEAFWAGYRQQLGRPTDVEVIDFEAAAGTGFCLGQVTVPRHRRSKPKRTWG